MKNLIFINGTMGVGKSTTCQELKKLLPKCVFLDGDWCWDMSPFVVTEETKNMVLDNITHLLNNFLSCSDFENIIFCWVMHETNIISDILAKIESKSYTLFQFSLVCSQKALEKRLLLDIDKNIRAEDIVKRSVSRLPNYESMDTVKVDVSEITAQKAAEQIKKQIGLLNAGGKPS